MPRKRLDAPVAPHHIIIRGIERSPIFKGSRDYENFLTRLGSILTETATTCYAWALLTNHIHLRRRRGSGRALEPARGVRDGGLGMPDYGCVIRLRPQGYFKRFQPSINTIRDCLAYWVHYHRWKTGPSPPRQRHWVKALRSHLTIHEGLNRIEDLVAGFDQLWELGIIPVSRSL